MKRKVTYPDRFSDWIDPGKESCRDRLAQHNDSRGRPDVGGGKERALFHFPTSDFREFLVRSLNAHEPILIAENQLAG